MKNDDAFHARLALDSQLPQLQSAAQSLRRPIGGWIQAIRLGLGMSTTDLARRLQINQSSALRMQDSEIEGTISLSTLQRAADALDCEFVYAFVPRQSLEQTVRERAVTLARKKLLPTQRTMALEKQALSTAVLDKLIEAQANQLANSRDLWKESRSGK